MRPKIFKLRLTNGVDFLNLLIKADSISEATSDGMYRLKRDYVGFRLIDISEMLPNSKTTGSQMVYDQTKLLGKARKWKFLAKQDQNYEF